ncbi:transcriptional protein SWT1-like isoform X3 [Ictalurus furcatus]|uniref:transcriptional protein SWT1-like isoform X3 n=1 Tax=Ictalurus furcatus TaxID=66913 RepID=UPI002350E972|nr:transcriptional protein SWT1-like isoform X3 [Ictalurus furcatus]
MTLSPVHQLSFLGPLLTAAMPRKKTRTKKHKKERKKHRSSSSSSEDQGTEDRERRRSSRRDKNKHVSSESTDCPRPRSREIPAKSGIYKKSDGESMKEKSEVNKDSRGHEYRALHSSVKHSSSSRYTSTSTKSSSNQVPEAPTKEQPEWRKSQSKRRSSSEEPGKREEKRKKLMKRRTSKEDDYSMTKRRSSKEQAYVGRRERKELVETGYSKSNEARISEWKPSSQEKIHQNSSKESKSPASVLTHNISQKTQGKGHSESICPPTSPTSGEDLPLSSPSLKVTFKIPKKSNVVKAQTSTSIWEHVKKSPATKKSSPKMIDSPSVKVTPEHTQPIPAEVPSPVPSRSPPVQRAQSCRTKETSTPSSSNGLLERACCYDASTECTETSDNDYEMQIVEELHLARSNRQLHVKVEKSYGELTSMDVDPADESATIALSQKQQQDLLIVLDTNVLLSHLDFVKRIRSHGLGALGFPTLLVPWVVLQELDLLKSGKLSKNVESKARPAVDYIYTSLKNQEPRLWGQSMQQECQAACRLIAMNNDDLVLQCCLQYKTLYPGGTIMLCTNDKNLCSKALLSGVKALSKADLQEQAEVNPEHFHQHYSQTSAYPQAVPVKQHQEAEKPQRSCEEVQASRKKETERELSECVSVLESSLQSALSAILEEEMKAAFGELWLEIVYVKPPWSLDALLQCFRKHWIAVFGVIIRRSLISCVETLSSFVRTDVSVEQSSVLNAVSMAEELLTSLRCRSPYSGHVDSALSCLKTLQQRLQPQKSPVDDRSGDTLMADAVQDVAPPLHASHQEVWALFESIWNNVCQVSSAVFSALHFSPGSAGSVEPRSTPPPQDALSCLHRLSTALEQLLEAFQRLLSVGRTVEDAQALLTFIQTSEIASMEPHFTAKDLFECLSHQEYREKLCIGGAQLMELRENLHRCAATVCGTTTYHQQMASH